MAHSNQDNRKDTSVAIGRNQTAVTAWMPLVCVGFVVDFLRSNLFGSFWLNAKKVFTGW
jgi:hypothetical protein